MIQHLNPITLIMLLSNNFIEIYCINKISKTFLKKRAFFSDKQWLVQALCVVFLGVMTLFNLPGKLYLNMVSSIGLSFAVMFLFYELNSYRCLLYWALNYINAAISEMVGVVLMQVASSVNNIDYDANFENILLSGATVLMKPLFCEFICHFGKRKDDKRNIKSSLIFLLLPAFSIVLFVCFSFRVGNVVYSEETYIVSIVFYLVLLAMNIVCFFAIERYSDACENEILLNEEKLISESEKDILSLSAKAMEYRLLDSEKRIELDRVMRHDRRHFEATLFTLLQDGRIEDAKGLLQERLNQEPTKRVNWCSNTTINAAISYYVQKMDMAEIEYEIKLDIPQELPYDTLKFAIAIGNLMENAIHECEKITKESRYIKMKSIYKSQFLLEIRNSSKGKVKLDDNCRPFSDKDNHGIGTKSVIRFIEEVGGEIFYTANDNEFIVKIILPL